MKRSLLKIAAAFFIAARFTACGIPDISSPPQPKLSGGFSCDCTVTSTILPPDKESGEEVEFVFSGKLSRFGAGFFELDITSPETVSGMKISSRDGDISSSLGDLSMELSTENVPHSSPVYAIFSNIDSMAVAFENGGELVSGDNDGWAYQCDGLSAVFDSEGYLTSMALASPKLTAEFSNFVTSDVSETSPESSSEQETSVSTEITVTIPPVTSEITAPETTMTMTSASSETEISTSSETSISHTVETTPPITIME